MHACNGIHEWRLTKQLAQSSALRALRIMSSLRFASRAARSVLVLAQPLSAALPLPLSLSSGGSSPWSSRTFAPRLYLAIRSGAACAACDPEDEADAAAASAAPSCGGL